VRLPPALLLIGACACGARSADAPTERVVEAPYAGPWSPRPSPGAEVVAEVNAEPIWDTDVAAYAKAHDLAPRAALDELIALELLAEEARRRGLGADPEVIRVGRRERVRRLVDSFAARTDEVAEIPASDVDTIWNRAEVQLALNHGELHHVGFVRVHVRKQDTPEQQERALRLAEEMRAHLIAFRPPTFEAFQKEANAYHQRRSGKPVEGGRPLAIEEASNVDPHFKKAALALRTPGELSPVTRTRWGWDILYFVQLIPERRTTRAEADAELRSRIHEDWRRMAFLRWLDPLVAAARVLRRDEILERVEVDSTFGLP
jgi:hypothetical protein